MKYTVKEAADSAIKTVINRYPAAKLPPEGHFHYHQGVFLSGVEKVAEILNNGDYFRYIKDWVDAMSAPNGEIHCFNPGALDDLQPGILLFGLLSRTHDERYKLMLDKLTSLLPGWDMNAEGGYFHMTGMDNQMWLDGLYMAGPLAVRYGICYNKPELVSLAFRQMKLMYKHCFKKESGLLVHGWDCSHKAEWANPDTGCAPEVWGRAMGWFVIGGLDMLELLPCESEDRKWAEKVVSELVSSLLKYQDKNVGLWYQVVDKPDYRGNWHESSCSMLFTCAVMRCVRLGLLPRSALELAKKGLDGVHTCVHITKDNEFVLNKICVGTGIGSYEYYIKRETSANDLHGMGAYLLMCAEAIKTFGENTAAEIE